VSRAIPIILSDKYWVPKAEVKTKRLDDNFRHLFFNEQGCRQCEYKDVRPSDACTDCESFGGDFRLYEPKVIGTNKYIGLPRGNIKAIKEVVPGFKDLRVKDRRVEALPLPKKLKWVGSLFDYQEKAVAKLMSKERGIIHSAPRTGKTVIASAYAIRRGRRVIIMAHQEDLLKQFLETLMNPDFTNMEELQERTGKTYARICSTYEEFRDTPIALCTYQTFLSKKGRRKLKKVTKLPFDAVILDEIHRAGATGYSKVVSSFKTRAKFGLTATPDRKDGKQVFPYAIVGPVIFRTGATSMAPTIMMVETKLKITKNYSNWTYAMRALEQLDGRDELIVKHVIRDLKKGHNIVIPVTFTRHAQNLVRAINTEWGSTVACEFIGTKKKEEKRHIILMARKSKKYRVIVAQRSMLTGINVPRWSMLYEIAPISNEPNLQQEVMRICTPMDNKRKPIIKFFVDDFGISRACFRSCDASFTKFREEMGGFAYTRKSKKVREKVLSVLYATKAVRRAPVSKKDPNYWRKKQDSKYTPRRVSSAKSVLKF